MTDRLKIPHNRLHPMPQPARVGFGSGSGKTLNKPNQTGLTLREIIDLQREVERQRRYDINLVTLEEQIL